MVKLPLIVVAMLATILTGCATPTITGARLFVDEAQPTLVQAHTEALADRAAAVTPAEVKAANKAVNVTESALQAGAAAQAALAIAAGESVDIAAAARAVGVVIPGPYGKLAELALALGGAVFMGVRAKQAKDTAKSLADAVQAVKAHVPEAKAALESPKAQDVLLENLSDSAHKVFKNATTP